MEKEVTIEIADTGVGIPEELWSTMFDPFVRGDKARTASGGTGLGLSIAMKNTEKMGGRFISVDERRNLRYSPSGFRNNELEDIQIRRRERKYG